MSERTNNPERIYLEPPPYSPEGRQWCEDNVWPLDGDGPGGVEYVRADLATPEPGGEGVVDDDLRDLAGRLECAADMLNDGEQYWIGGGDDVAVQIIADLREAATVVRASARPVVSDEVLERVAKELEEEASYHERMTDTNTALSRGPVATGLLRRAAALLRTPRGEGRVTTLAGLTEDEMDRVRDELRAMNGLTPRSEAQGEVLLHAASDAYDILDGAPCPADDPVAWREDVKRRLASAIRAARRGEGGRHV